MFELGARPHPPRALYRSYLAQSDVFVGIYGDSYGWVAPGRGGLRTRGRVQPRARGRCRSSSTSRRPTTRDERLDELIDRIRADDTAAYLPFETAEELEEQVVGDLATLLAERFDESRASR